MESFKWLAALMCLWSYTDGQDFLCLDLRPSNISHDQFQSSMLFSLETIPEENYVPGSVIQVTITSVSSSLLNEVYIAAHDISANKLIGTWMVPSSSDYSAVQCFDGPTVLSYRSSSDNQSPMLTFTWQLPTDASTPELEFFFRVTVIPNGQNYWQVQSEIFTVDTTLRPTATCPDTTQSFPTNGNGMVVIWFETPCTNGEKSNCTGDTGEVYPPGMHTIMCFCEDEFGISDTCDFSFTVEGTIPPQFICPTPELFSPPNGDTIVVWPGGSCNDAEGVQLTITCNETQGMPQPMRDTYIGCNCTDTSGGVAQCTFVVNVPANSEPMINCPTPSVQPQIDGNSMITWTGDICNDAEDGTQLEVTCNETQGVILPPGNAYIRCSCMDSSGSVAQCVFVVNISAVPNSEPMISCPTPSVQPQTNGSYLVTWTDDICNDAEDGPQLEVTCNETQGILQPGDTYIGCSCVDSSGSVAQCVFVANVPVETLNLSCPERTTVSITQEGSDFVASADLPECTDVMTGSSLSVECNVTLTDAFLPGDYNVGCTCTHPSGAIKRCVYVLTFPDPGPRPTTAITSPTEPDLPPVLSCSDSSSQGILMPQNLPSCTAQNFMPLLLDCNVTEGNSLSPGIHYVECSCTDDSNRQQSCVFTVTVPEPPSVLSCSNSSSQGTLMPQNLPSCAAVQNSMPDCNVTEGSSLSPGVNYVECSCTDDSSRRQSCVFIVTVLDPVPRPTTADNSPTENCPIPVLDNTFFSCPDGMEGVQTNCSLECTNNTVKTIPDFGLISCRSDNMWEPRVIEKLCQRPVEPISRSVLINVPVDTSAADCNKPRNLDGGIKIFFRNISSMALMKYCTLSGIQEENCTQSTSVEVDGVCVMVLGRRRRRQSSGKAVVNVSLNVTSALDDQFVVNVATNVLTGLPDNPSESINLETNEYTATLTEENRQAVTISNITYNCLFGHARVGDGLCVLCPPGTYLTAVDGTCKLCESGRFQDKSGQTSCKKCDSASKTDHLPGLTQCTGQISTEMPDEDLSQKPNSIILYIAIGIAAVLVLFIAILSVVTIYLRSFVKTGDEKEVTLMTNNDIGTHFPLQDYAGRTEGDDDNIDTGGQCLYDSPPPQAGGNV